MLRRILSSEKIVKGEGRIKYRNLFQIFFIPRRILSYVKIVKGESRKPSLLEFFAGLSPFLDPASQRGVTCWSYRIPMRYPGKTWVGEPARYIPFTFLSGPRVAARGDALGHTAPRCGIQEILGRESPQNTFLFTSLSGPASQRGVTCRSYRTLMRYPGKARAGEPAKYIPFYVPLWPRVAARGDALGHTAPRCGIQEKIRQESPPNPFLLRPTLDPASQRGVTCRSYRTLMRYPGKARAGVSARYIPFTSLSGPASQRGVTCRSYRTPMRYPGKDQARVSAKSIPFTSHSGPRVAARGDALSYRTPMRYPEKARAGEPAEYIPFYVPLWTPRRSAG